MSESKQKHRSIKDGRKRIRVDEASCNLTKEEAELLHEIRQLPTMQERADFIASRSYESSMLFPPMFISLLAKEPSVARETNISDSNERTLLYHLCICKHMTEYSKVQLLPKVLQACSDSVPDDPSVFFDNLAAQRGGRLDDLEVMSLLRILGERWLIPSEVKNLPSSPRIYCRGIPFVTTCESTTGIALFDSYPRMIHHISEFSIPCPTYDADATEVTMQRRFARRILDYTITHRGVRTLSSCYDQMTIWLRPAVHSDDKSRRTGSMFFNDTATTEIYTTSLPMLVEIILPTSW